MDKLKSVKIPRKMQSSLHFSSRYFGRKSNVQRNWSFGRNDIMIERTDGNNVSARKRLSASCSLFLGFAFPRSRQHDLSLLAQADENYRIED